MKSFPSTSTLILALLLYLLTLTPVHSTKDPDPDEEAFVEEQPDLQQDLDLGTPPVHKISKRAAPKPGEHPPVNWGIPMNHKTFSQYWPPKRDDGTVFENSENGLHEWYEYISQQGKKFSDYLNRKAVIKKEVEDKYFEENGVRIILDDPPRAYPFCVDGFLPFLDRYRPNYKTFDGGLVDDSNKPEGTKEIYWGAKDAITFEKKSKDCEFGGTYPEHDCIDVDLERFIPLFVSAQPLTGGVVTADARGKPAISHLVNGEDKGPYIQKITFSQIESPKPPTGISHPPPDGSIELPFWFHIIVKSRIPLAGLYMQAIGFPMGLPFGNFRDDFDCHPGKLADKHPKQIKVQSYKEGGASIGKRQNLIIPCKYSHGNNNGDMYPNVYAYGGKVLNGGQWPKHEEFRFHFSYSSVHCNLKTRIQFLVMAVADFDTHDAETFLTANYLLSQYNAAGSPPPYIHGSKEDYGWDGAMHCAKEALITSPTNDPSAVYLEYDQATSSYQIPYDGGYDKCITQDNDDQMSNFFADDFKEMLLNRTVTQDAPAKPLRDFIKDESTSAKGELGLQQWTLSRKMMQICPPADICLNEAGDGKYTENYDEHGHPINSVTRIRKYTTQLKESTFPKCKVSFCGHPNTTVPLLETGRVGPGNTGDGLDPEEAKNESIYGGTRFSEAFTREFFKRGSLHFRRARGTHVWSMSLAWFTLMALGAFTARYYKETAGIDANTKNSILGLGYWIWVHIILFLLSLTFMWIGILETARFRQRPISCNLLEIYAEYALKNTCRWKKKIVRHHRKIGIAAVFCYHIALAISWARPARKLKCFGCMCKLPFRKIFVWVHVIFAYLGKFLCIVSIFLFFWPKAEAICVGIPIILVFTEFLSIVFFVAGWVLMCMEDRKLNKSRRVFPVPEALEPGDTSPCYCAKVGVVIASAVIHFIMFLILVAAVYFVYMTVGRGTDKQAAFEEEQHGLGGKCRLVTSRTELEASMEAYYFRKTSDADVGNDEALV